MKFRMGSADRKKGRTGVLVGLGVTAAVLALLVACSNYGEGERCQSANGDDDCVSGLVCTPAAQLTNTSSDRCCPSDRTLATATVCKSPVSVEGSSDAAASGDTGLGTESDATTSTGDAGTDSGSDASDAAADG